MFSLKNLARKGLMSISGVWKDLKSSQLDHKKSLERSYLDWDWNVNNVISSHIYILNRAWGP